MRKAPLTTWCYICRLKKSFLAKKNQLHVYENFYQVFHYIFCYVWHMKLNGVIADMQKKVYKTFVAT